MLEKLNQYEVMSTNELVSVEGRKKRRHRKGSVRGIIKNIAWHVNIGGTTICLLISVTLGEL